MGYYAVAKNYDTNFGFEWLEKYFRSELNERVKYSSCDENIYKPIFIFTQLQYFGSTTMNFSVFLFVFLNVYIHIYIYIYIRILFF